LHVKTNPNQLAMPGASGQVVISNSELARIKSSLLPEQMANSSKAEKATELHARSQARAKTWGNTLEGSRRKKAEEKRKKLEMEELERQKIDAEEAKIQLEQRKHTIDRANKLLYDESDRMKSFHSKMMLCDVLAEREAQVNLKEELSKLEQIREERHLEMERGNYRKMLERELREKEEREEISKIAAVAQKQQLREFKDRRLREIEDGILEGELLRKKAREDLESERTNERKRRAQAAQALVETQKANEYLKEIKAEDLLRQQREEDKIEEYAQRKEQMLELRKRKEEEVFKEKQAMRQKMIDTQAKSLMQSVSNEEARLEKQVLEKEIHEEKKRLEKEEAMRKWQDEIDRSRQQQIHRKRVEREKDRNEEAETAAFLSEWCKTLDKQEQDEQDLKRMAAKKLSNEHKKQVEIQRRRKEETKSQDDHVATRAKRAMEADTIEFHNYAESCIRDYAEEGKNVIPLIKELREFRKRVQE
jgi:hypothetical protein